MTPKLGRRSKYAPYIHQLKDEDLHCGASIPRYLEENGALQHIPRDQLKTFKTRMRVALNNKARSFPRDGDGTLYLYGHGEVKGYRAKRWKEAYPLVFDGNSPHTPPNTILSLDDKPEADTCQNSK